MYYSDSDFCDTDKIDPTSGFPTRTDNAPWPSPFILMVDRGTCSFVQKARNAQHAGAAGLIIADNRCLCSDVACHNLYGISEGCENNVPSVVDDGSGGDVTIPAFLMFKVDADEIKKEVKDRDGIVQLEMGWSMPSPDSKVDYELWTVPSQESSKKFQRNGDQLRKP